MKTIALTSLTTVLICLMLSGNLYLCEKVNLINTNIPVGNLHQSISLKSNKTTVVLISNSKLGENTTTYTSFNTPMLYKSPLKKDVVKKTTNSSTYIRMLNTTL